MIELFDPGAVTRHIMKKPEQYLRPEVIHRWRRARR